MYSIKELYDNVISKQEFRDKLKKRLDSSFYTRYVDVAFSYDGYNIFFSFGVLDKWVLLHPSASADYMIEFVYYCIFGYELYYYEHIYK